MFLYDALTVRKADRKAMEDLSIPCMFLMENAARSAAEHIVRFYGKPSKVTIACGKGNNGGDGLALARLLKSFNIETAVLMTGKPDKMTATAAGQYAIACRLQIPLEDSKNLDDQTLSHFLRRSDLLVDGLLGTGSKGAPKGETDRIITLLNSSQRPVVSLDVPSGVDASTGKIAGNAVQATSTVTFLAPKTGLYVMPGRAFSGHVETGHIGIPPLSILPSETDILLADEEFAFPLLPRRTPFTHKGKRGMVLIFGGSRLYGGAPVLAAKGALRSGAGVVVVVTPESSVAVSAGALPEAIFYAAPSRDGFLLPEAYDAAMEQWGEKASSIVAGPGIGRHETVSGLIRRIWERSPVPVCLDADGLHCLSDPGFPRTKRQDAILTPHEGEAAELACRDTAMIASQRLETARLISQQWGTTILKGAGTIIDSGRKRAVVGKDHPCLSVPGSGDVLSGVAGAFLAAGIESFEAATLAAFLHAKAGVLLGGKAGSEGTLASEIADMLPKSINSTKGPGHSGERPNEGSGE